MDLEVHDLREDKPIGQRIYLYEEDYEALKVFILAMKHNCTADEINQIFNYLWEKKADEYQKYEPTEEERKKIAEQLANSEWMKKAMEELKKK